jgi:hypothetical protein
MIRDYVPAWLGNAIERELGDSYRVDSEPEFRRGPDVRGGVDILIWPTGQSTEVIAVLIEHVPRGFELPLLTEEITQRILDANKHIELHLIVATMNIVCSLLRAALEKQGVSVVVGDSIQELADGIVQVVTTELCQ